MKNFVYMEHEFTAADWYEAAAYVAERWGCCDSDELFEND